MCGKTLNYLPSKQRVLLETAALKGSQGQREKGQFFQNTNIHMSFCVQGAYGEQQELTTPTRRTQSSELVTSRGARMVRA